MSAGPGTARESDPPSADPDGTSAPLDNAALDSLLRLAARGTGAPMAALCLGPPDDLILAAGLGGVPPSLGARPWMQTILQHDGVCTAPGGDDHEFAFIAGIAIAGADRQAGGVLCVLDTAPQALDADGRATLQDLRRVIAEHLRLHADLLHDPRSQALARAPFENLAWREWRRAMRSLKPLSLLVAELDDLQAYAAIEGAAVRDRCLHALSLAMHYSLHRPGDHVGRYDERRFVALLPDTDEAGAEEAAERVREAVEALRMPNRDAAQGVLTLSQGIHTLRGGALARDTLGDAVEAATRALRQAQRDGGNRWALSRYLRADADPPGAPVSADTVAPPNSGPPNP